MSIKKKCKGATQTVLGNTWKLRRTVLRNRIVYYHSIHPELPLSTAPEVFEQHIVLAKELGYRFITHQQIPQEINQVGTAPWLAVGFDDGYEDNHRFAAPVLDRQKVPATFFVVAGQIRKTSEYPTSGYQLYPDRRMLSIAQLRSMAESGHEIASHGLQHELATAVVRSGRDLSTEYRKSRSMLSSWTGQEILSYSYPNGQHGAYSARTREAAITAGFKTAAVTIWGTVKAECDLFALPRCEIAAEDGSDAFVRKLTGKDDYRSIAHRVRRRPTWSQQGTS